MGRTRASPLARAAAAVAWPHRVAIAGSSWRSPRSPWAWCGDDNDADLELRVSWHNAAPEPPHVKKMLLCPHCHRTSDQGAFCPHDGTELTAEPRIGLLKSEPCKQSGMTIAGRYRIEGQIGRGAMGVVYLANDVQRGEPVAIKTLASRGAKARERMRLLNSVIAAAEIDHPNVTRIEDVGETDGAPYVVMELLWGEPLSQRLAREAPLPPRLALEVARDVSEGLAAAHAAGVLHRDVKPHNIFLLGAPGESYGAKVIDFGLAKSRVNITEQGVAVGTVSYMAPEQVLTDDVGPTSDLYSVGVSLFRMLTGRLPFEGDEPTRLMARQLLEAAPTLEGDDPLLQRAAPVVRAALRKVPENRYSSMSALSRDLERLLSGSNEPLEVPGLSVTPDTYRPKQPFAHSAAGMFYRMMGLAVPPWIQASR